MRSQHNHHVPTMPRPTLLAWRRKSYRPTVALPTIGGIYRDRDNRSLLVLTLHEGRILVEYADGETRTIDVVQWYALRPVRSVC